MAYLSFIGIRATTKRLTKCFRIAIQILLTYKLDDDSCIQLEQLSNLTAQLKYTDLKSKVLARVHAYRFDVRRRGSTNWRRLRYHMGLWL